MEIDRIDQEDKHNLESDKKRQKLYQDAFNDFGEDERSLVWAKLSSITSQTTRTIPS